MFSGIIEAQASIQKVTSKDHLVEIILQKPSLFNDISTGDSIAMNGVCLTVENFNETDMQFSIAAETLQVTQWDLVQMKDQNRLFNLERSLFFGARIHGHWVTGHVDGRIQLSQKKYMGESLILTWHFAPQWQAFLWKKGSVAINGVSLTLNEVAPETFSVCLIPETLKRTNLSQLEPGDFANLEVDNFARAFVNWLQLKEQTS